MRKKLLAGMLALALCSTNMPLQTIFAEEFTSGNQDVVSEEETPYAACCFKLVDRRNFK